MKNLFLSFLLLILTPTVSLAYIMPTHVILEKVTKNTGNGIYAIEQEVTFDHPDTPITVKETWLIENDRSLKLTVSLPTAEGDKFFIQNIYHQGKKISMNKGNDKKIDNVSFEFLERYFNARDPNALANLLTQLKIIPPGAMRKKPLPKTSAEIKYSPESWVRFGRSQGVVNYAFGVPTPVNRDEPYPGLWIEQDQFVIRKLRFPTQAEVTANDYNNFSKNLIYPKIRNVRWDNNSVTIKLLSASPRPNTVSKQISENALNVVTDLSALDSHSAKNMILEFYKRFR